MRLTVNIGGTPRIFETDSPIDISIPLRFNGPQPNAYGVERAVSSPCEAGEMVGDTRRGGSVNFEQYTFIPHCNGTHTECVGHITHERISVCDCLQDALMTAVLISVDPEVADAANAADSELVITRRSIEASLPAPYAGGSALALIVRTLPNDQSKLTREYGELVPPYFATDAMNFIVQYGFRHLLVDMPSIDRILDDGKLLNHRIFWDVEPGAFATNADTRLRSTITELIYVPNEVEDGEYLLSLQIAPFGSDCSPSRPILLACGNTN